MYNGIQALKFSYTAEEAKAKLEAELKAIDQAHSDDPVILERILRRLQAEKTAREIHAMISC